tara:strand:+ start:488 stop:889 length:402 start_codon:yes stop_codon:yes gene_type:complete
MPGNKKLSSNIKSMGFMKRSAEKVDIETNESKKRKRELEIFEKQWKTATTTNNNKINKKGISNNSGLIIVKNKKSQHNYGRRSFSGYNKTVENHLARGSNNNNNDEDDDTPKKKKKKKNKKNNTSSKELNINN